MSQHISTFLSIFYVSKHVSVCQSLFQYISKCFKVIQDVQMLKNICQYFPIFLRISQHLSTCSNLFWCPFLDFTMFDYVSLYFSIFQHVLIYFYLFPCTSTSFNKFKMLHYFRAWWNMLSQVLWYSNIGLDLAFLGLLFQYIQQTCMWLYIDYYGLNHSASDIKKLLHWKNDDLIVLRFVISRAW
jgi:hypothetical protein